MSRFNCSVLIYVETVQYFNVVLRHYNKRYLQPFYRYCVTNVNVSIWLILKKHCITSTIVLCPDFNCSVWYMCINMLGWTPRTKVEKYHLRQIHCFRCSVQFISINYTQLVSQLVSMRCAYKRRTSRGLYVLPWTSRPDDTPGKNLQAAGIPSKTLRTDTHLIATLHHPT